MWRWRGTAWWPPSAGTRSPGLLGLASLWRNSSAPPGALPAAACHRCGKAFIQQFPRELGTQTVHELRAWQPAACAWGLGGAEVPGRGGLAGGRPGVWGACALRPWAPQRLGSWPPGLLPAVP